eukprot:282986-Karenia_brevis.AAC.1
MLGYFTTTSTAEISRINDAKRSHKTATPTRNKIPNMRKHDRTCKFAGSTVPLDIDDEDLPRYREFLQE